MYLNKIKQKLQFLPLK